MFCFCLKLLSLLDARPAIDKIEGVNMLKESRVSFKAPNPSRYVYVPIRQISPRCYPKRRRSRCFVSEIAWIKVPPISKEIKTPFLVSIRRL